MNKNILTFLGCDGEYEDSRIVVFGVPFDGTTSYRPGARFAPACMRMDSEYAIETYSPYLNKDLTDYSIFDGGDLEIPFGNTKRVLDIIEDYVERLIKDNKIACMLGGEHLVTLGAVRAYGKYYDDLHIIHFDAHPDLRDEYLGEKLSHATVMRRCWEIVGDGRIFQYGIRSGDREELRWGREHVKTHMFDFAGIETLREKLKDKPIYLTIDLDVIDPSEFPGTGTPEAGGVTFKELLKALSHLQGLNIVGFDMVELSPPNDPTGISTALACKLLRELLLQIMSNS